MKLLNALKNKRGSTLILVMVTVPFMLIITGAFYDAVLSFTTRTETMHHEQQAYISARSVAETLASEISDYSHRLIMALEPEIRAEMHNLDDALKTGPAVEAGLTQVQEDLVYDISALAVGESITINDINFNNAPDELNVGTLSAKITRESSRFIVDGICVVNDTKHKVTTELNGEEYYIVIEGRENDDEANSNVFYSDLGLGLEDGSVFREQVLDGVKRVISAPFYYANGTGAFEGNVHTYEEIVVYNFLDDPVNKPQKTGGDFVAHEDIVFESQSIYNVGVDAKEILYIKDNTTITGGSITVQADTIYIQGDDITIQVPIFANNIIFDGQNIEINMNITAERVQVVRGTSVPSSTLQMYTHTQSFFLVDEPVISIDDPLPADAVEITGSGYLDASYQPCLYEDRFISYNAQGFTTYVKEPTPDFLARAKPFWADIAGDRAISYTPSTTMDGGLDHYYTIDGLTETLGWRYMTISNTTTSGHDDEEPIRILVKDGQKLWVDTSNTWTGLGANFILMGNAKLVIDGSETSYGTFRTYGEPLERELFDEIIGKMHDVVDMYSHLPVGESTGIIQNKIKDIVTEYTDRINIMYLTEGTVLQGTYVVNYVTSEADLNNPSIIPSLYLRGNSYSGDAYQGDADEGSLGDGGVTAPEPEDEEDDLEVAITHFEFTAFVRSTED